MVNDNNTFDSLAAKIERLERENAIMRDALGEILESSFLKCMTSYEIAEKALGKS